MHKIMGYILNLKKLFALCISFVFVISSSACFKSKPEVYHFTGTDFTDYYVSSLQGLSYCEYERITLGNPHSLVPGPTDYEYRGIIHLSEEEAEKIFNSYSWTEDTSFSCPDFGTVNTSFANNDSWYSCHEFQNDYFNYLNVHYLRFNGKDAILFDAISM